MREGNLRCGLTAANFAANIEALRNGDARAMVTMSTTTGSRPFLKMHGLRNHFVIVDARELPYRPDESDIVRICDPQVGVGADQLVVIEPSDRADAFMRLFNVDGREVEACGNATRCVAWLLMEESKTDAVAIETLADVLACQRRGDLSVSCDMGSVRLAWEGALHVDLSEGVLADPVAVNVGNPHVVYFVDDVAGVDVVGVAPAIQSNPMFPQSVNVGVAQRLADDHLQLVVFERGAGLTTACGSGACAAVFAARARGLIEAERVRVSMPAGEVTIEVSTDGRATMTGPVAYCFEGRL